MMISQLIPVVGHCARLHLPGVFADHHQQYDPTRHILLVLVV